MARIPTETGTVIKETKYSEIVPAGTAPKDREQLGFWEYIESLKPEEFSNHIAYVYRWEKDGATTGAGKLMLPFDEFTLKDNFGGGSFRIILKKGAQICKRIEKVTLEGKSKIQDEVTASTPALSSQQNSSEMTLLAQILAQQSQMIERILTRDNTRPMVDEGLRGAMTLQGEVFRSSIDTVRNTLTPGAGGSADPFKDKLLDILLTRAFAPPPSPVDPIKTFVEMAAAVKQILPSEPSHTSVGIELVRALGGALPQVAQAFVASQSQYVPRPGMPGGGRTIDMGPAQQPTPMRANADDNRAGVAPVAMMPAPATLPADTNGNGKPVAPPPQGGEVMAPNLEWIESRVVDLISHPELTPRDAANEVLSFLQTAAPNMLPQLANETSLRWLFNNRTILKMVPDDARREEFLQAFLAMVNAPAPAAAPAAEDALLTTEPPPAA